MMSDWRGHESRINASISSIFGGSCTDGKRVQTIAAQAEAKRTIR